MRADGRTDRQNGRGKGNRSFLRLCELAYRCVAILDIRLFTAIRFRLKASEVFALSGRNKCLVGQWLKKHLFNCTISMISQVEYINVLILFFFRNRDIFC